MKATISLSIIVRNESKVILTMLNSVYTLLDYYVIVDTGSTDNTKDIIKKFFDEKGIPGEIVDHTWKNYGDARNIAIEVTKDKADYNFWIDADDELIIDSNFNVDIFKQQLLNYDALDCQYFNTTYEYKKISFFLSKKPWKWFGALHEVLICNENVNVGIANGLKIIQHSNGYSWSNPNKWQDYYDMINDFMSTIDENDPLYSRWLFYFAQTCAESEKFDKAIEYYEKRIKFDTISNNEEVYISLFKLAQIKAYLGYFNDAINIYLQCHEENPNRLEHIAQIIQYYNSIEQYEIAYIYSSYAMKFAGKLPNNSYVLLDHSVYLWKIYDLHNISCWWTGRIEEAKETFKLLWKQVENGLVDENEIERITYNKQFNLD